VQCWLHMVKPGEPSRAGQSEALMRSLLVLEALSGMAQPASLDRVRARTQLPKSKAYRALRSLQDEGFVDRVGRQGYRVGGRSLALSLLIGPRPALLQALRPVVRWLSDVTGQTATLHLRSGHDRVLALGAGPKNTRSQELPPIGERAPLSVGCGGTSILAFLPVDEADEVLGSTNRPGQDADTVDLAAIRSDGFALSFASNHAGANGVAAPILNPLDSYPLGSLAIAGPSDRLSEAKLREFALPLRRACAQLGPHLATMLGPNSSERLDALDVAVRNLIDE
jgi:IclR family transcriptional regulator, acetate operon repressor